MPRRTFLFFIALAIASSGIEVADNLSAMGKIEYVRPAQALVGRPLTPVSVAGVARRSVRRCAVGVYYC